MTEQHSVSATRRTILAVASSAALGPNVAHAQASPQPVAATQAGAPPGTMAVKVTVNGTEHTAQIDPRMTVLDLLREKLALTGTKKGCDHGQCGACTIHVDGHSALACLTLAASADGRRVTTIEGLAEGDRLHPMQQAFMDHDAFQCGYCTPGQIMSAVACVTGGHATSDADIREFMSGNLCRCAAYPNIVAAINQAKTRMGA